MRSDIYVYSVIDYSGEPQLECLLDPEQLRQCLAQHFVVRDRANGIYRLTTSGEAELLAAEQAGDVDY